MPAELTDAALLDRLAGVLAGADDALLPLAGTDEHSRQTAAALRVGEPIDGRIALVVPTSGSTGSPKGAQLSADALLAAAAILDALDGRAAADGVGVPGVSRPSFKSPEEKKAGSTGNITQSPC